MCLKLFLVPWISQLPLYVDPIFGGVIPNELVCKFDSANNSSSLSCTYIHSIYWCSTVLVVQFYSVFTIGLTCELIPVLCTSISIDEVPILSIPINMECGYDQVWVWYTRSIGDGNDTGIMRIIFTLKWWTAKHNRFLKLTHWGGVSHMSHWTVPSLAQVMACGLFSTKPLPELKLDFCQLGPENKLQ